MKEFLLILLLLPLIGASQGMTNQTDQDGLKQGKWIRSYPNGKLMYEGTFRDDKPAGEWKRYHESGALKAVMKYIAGSDSVDAVLYDINGKPIAEGKYVAEKKTGLWKQYSDGRIISEEEFVNGIKEGKSRIFYPTGELLEESEWKGDKRNGNYRAFYLSGKPFLECRYENDQRNGFCVSWFPSGVMEVDAFYRNDLPEGEWKYYSEKGELRYVLQYSEGYLLNREVLLEVETRNLQEQEKAGKNITDPEKFMQNPSEFLMRMQHQPN